LCKILSMSNKSISIKTRTSPLLGSHELKLAACNVKSWLKPTPLIRSAYLSEVTGAEVLLKLECLQPTRSFKVRGGINAVCQLDEQGLRRGVVTASGGNHGLGLTYAALLLGSRATVFLPESTACHKIEALKKLDAEIIIEGASWDDANESAMEFAARNERAYIHPFDNEHVMAGQGTIVAEILEQGPRPDLIVASIGGGGLLSGIASATTWLAPGTRIAGVETEGADCMSRSVRARKLVELPAITSIADSLGARRSRERQLAIIREKVSGIAVVDDRSSVEAILSTLDHDKVLLEPAASCNIAALTAKKIDYAPGETVVVVACGGNIDLARLLSFRERFGV